MNTTAYDEIMNLRGYPEFKELANRLRSLGESRRSLIDASIHVPNFLFVEDPGAGVTTQIRLLTRLIGEQKLMTFMGERRSFEWALDHDAFERNGSFDRLLNEVNAAAGFYSYFSGVIGIELGSWAHRPMDGRMNRLKDFVADTYGQIVFVFVTERKDDATIERLECALNAATPIECVHCPLPSHSDMTEYLVDFLRRRGFLVSDEARAMIADFMPSLMAVEGFDGMQTISVLAEEIVFNACSAAAGVTDATKAVGKAGQMLPVLRKEHFSFITEERGYIDRHRRSSSGNVRRIGFERVG